MPKIMIDTRNRIIFYGNPAGYVTGDQAVVDPMFQTDELALFLQKQTLEAKWQDGVYDRLVVGQDNGFDPEVPELKKCRIWQLTSDAPINMRFISYEAMMQKFGDPEPSNYSVVFDGQIESNDLEEIYAKFRSGNNPGFTGHLMSLSDVVELYDDAGSEFYYCDKVGFRQIEFSHLQQNQEMTM